MSKPVNKIVKKAQSAPLVTSNKKGVYLTSQGLAASKAELEYLKKTKRKEIADRIQVAREYGDLSENSEYETALQDQDLVESRISELEEALKGAKVIKEEHSIDFVVIGSTVKVEMDGELDEFTIVGRVEADPSKKRISNESPLGLALIGAKKNEEVEVTTPIVRYKCKVLEIK